MYEFCSDFIQGLYIDFFTEYGVRLTDNCLRRLQKTLGDIKALGFSVLDDKEGFLISIILPQRVSRVSYLKFKISTYDYVDVGAVYE